MHLQVFRFGRMDKTGTGQDGPDYLEWEGWQGPMPKQVDRGVGVVWVGVLFLLSAIDKNMASVLVGSLLRLPLGSLLASFFLGHT